MELVLRRIAALNTTSKHNVLKANEINLQAASNNKDAAFYSVAHFEQFALRITMSLHLLNVTIDTQDEKVEASDNVSCKANTEGKATHKNLHENSGKQVICCQLDSTLLSTTLETLSMALTLPLCLKSTREGSYDAIILPLNRDRAQLKILPSPYFELNEQRLFIVIWTISPNLANFYPVGVYVYLIPNFKAPYTHLSPSPPTLRECYLSPVYLTATTFNHPETPYSRPPLYPTIQGECYLRHVFLPTPNSTILSECPLNTVCSPISVSNTPELCL
ncbi:hypothetical protein T4D_11894 [Trichinella pseudospiralis]|uniref:Uncharacterized protein n=1 Tax=Trichinella pseudospiralis TaxID=6337 RepID=A0A0V1FWJ9_TRIPS|nr:hypothetical protein T4D_11894 [Trichinella pseudospiralis]